MFIPQRVEFNGKIYEHFLRRVRVLLMSLQPVACNLCRRSNIHDLTVHFCCDAGLTRINHGLQILPNNVLLHDCSVVTHIFLSHETRDQRFAHHAGSVQLVSASKEEVVTMEAILRRKKQHWEHLAKRRQLVVITAYL